MDHLGSHEQKYTRQGGNGKSAQEKRAVTRESGNGAHKQSDTRAKNTMTKGYNCKWTQRHGYNKKWAGQNRKGAQGKGEQRKIGTMAKLPNDTGPQGQMGTGDSNNRGKETQ